MATYPLSLSIIRLATDYAEVNATMESKFRAHVAAKALIAQFRALPPRAVCRDCGGVGMKVSLSLLTPVPCGACRPGPFADFMAALAYEYEVLRPVMAEEGGYDEDFLRKPSELEDEVPPTQRSGYADADPWTLADEELVTTAPLPREVPAYWGKDRGEYDPADDKQDLQPFTRGGKP